MKLIRITTVPISLNILLKGQLSFLNKYFEVIAVSGDGPHLSEMAERERVKTHVVKMERPISIFKDIKSLILLYRYFKKEKPEIIHSMTPKAGLLSMLAGRLAGVPIRMHTFTGLIFPTSSGLKKSILVLTDKILCWSATNIYPEGNGVKEDLLNYKITTKPLKILGNGNVNGVDLDFFNITQVSEVEKNNLRKNLDISEEDFVYIFIGRLSRDKGINELVSAFIDLKSPNLKLLLIGPIETDLKPLNSETFTEINSNKNIILAGFQKDVRPFLAISNALILPSYREGFPNAVLQAGAMNLPCVVTDINGSNEIIIHQQNGLIVPAKDSKNLSRAMYDLSSDKQLYHHLKNNSRPNVDLKYKQSIVWDALLKEYQNLTNEKDFK